jgi:alpha-ketoglutaric semialdehyde dehydrogenase
VEFKANSKFDREYGKTLVGYNLIDGKDTESESRARFNSTNSSQTEDVVGTFPQSTEKDVRSAVEAANRAFLKWKHVPAPVRANIIGKAGELLAQHKSEIAYLMTREMGKTLKESNGSVQEAIDTCQFFQSEGRRLYGMTVPSEMRNKELFTYRRPYGVVGIITPSNFPIAVASWKAIPALLCGNTVVWKSPPEAPTVAYLFAKLLQSAGLPNGVMNLVHGDGRAGKALVDLTGEHLVHKISFTGSTKVGRLIGETCGRNLQTPSLELGGKNPLVVMDDANLDQSVAGALWASFGTAGQRCTSAGNIILHKKIAAEFRKRFFKAANEIKLGNPLKDSSVLYGPLIDKHYYESFMNHFAPAEKSGSKKIMGDGRITSKNKPASFSGDPETGYYVFPTIWDDVKIDHWIAQEEVFGPAVSLIEVADLEEAIHVANGTQYGLSAAIYTLNRMSAYRFKTEVQSGMISINNSTTGAEAHLPFGGVKASGNGTRESGVWVIDAYTQWQAVNDEYSSGLQLAQMDTENLDSKPESKIDLTAFLPGDDPVRY